MAKTVPAYAVALSALILGFGGGIAGSALHPGSRGPVGPAGATGAQGVASSLPVPTIICALAPSGVPKNGSVQVEVPTGDNITTATTFLTVTCSAG